jgi:hypothetical protein
MGEAVGEERPSRHLRQEIGDPDERQRQHGIEASPASSATTRIEHVAAVPDQNLRIGIFWEAQGKPPDEPGLAAAAHATATRQSVPSAGRAGAMRPQIGLAILAQGSRWCSMGRSWRRRVQRSASKW